ncbi:MAG: hypothetical protein ACTS5F_01585 [Candidatus Hodgkinia cicadicola]
MKRPKGRRSSKAEELTQLTKEEWNVKLVSKLELSRSVITLLRILFGTSGWRIGLFGETSSVSISFVLR